VNQHQRGVRVTGGGGWDEEEEEEEEEVVVVVVVVAMEEEGACPTRGPSMEGGDLVASSAWPGPGAMAVAA